MPLWDGLPVCSMNHEAEGALAEQMSQRHAAIQRVQPTAWLAGHARSQGKGKSENIAIAETSPCTLFSECKRMERRSAKAHAACAQILQTVKALHSIGLQRRLSEKCKTNMLELLDALEPC